MHNRYRTKSIVYPESCVPPVSAESCVSCVSPVSAESFVSPVSAESLSPVCLLCPLNPVFHLSPVSCVSPVSAESPESCVSSLRHNTLLNVVRVKERVYRYGQLFFEFAHITD